MANQKNLHDGHRERMRERYINEGSDGLADHEMLEMLLYHGISRGNTNETAHRLLDCFGTLENVINADIRELQSIDGVGKVTAHMIAMVGEVYRRMAKQSCEMPKMYDKTEHVIQFLQSHFVGETVEKVYLMLLDNGLRVLNFVCLKEGSINAVGLDPRTIVNHVVESHASAIVLAHNHPGGVAIPSDEDIQVTEYLKRYLEGLQITLLEHFVFAGNRYLPILDETRDSQPMQVERHFGAVYLERHGEKPDT